MTTIAQATGQHALSVLTWLGVIVAFAAWAGTLGWWLLRRLQRQIDPGDPVEPFTLGDLRQLHREGKLSDEEFARAKAAMIAQVRARTTTDDDEPDLGEELLIDEDVSEGEDEPGFGGDESDPDDDDDSDPPR